MADIKVEDVNLQDLRRRASALASAVESLAFLFEEESTCLRRKDEVARLQVLRSTILQKVEQARMEELAASSGYNRARAVGSLFRLGAGLITMTSENRTMRAISRQLLAGPSSKEPPYGTVLVCIGPKGLLDDVEVVSISSLARESKRDESEIRDGLLAHGNLLFSDETFSHLIDRLNDEILKGTLGLPVSGGKLSQLQEWRLLRLNPKNED